MIAKSQRSRAPHTFPRGLRGAALLLLFAGTLFAQAAPPPVDALTPPHPEDLAIINEALDYYRAIRERPDGVRVRQVSPADFRVGERPEGWETIVYATDQNGRITHLQSRMGLRTLREFEILTRLRDIRWLITNHTGLPSRDRVAAMNLVAELPELEVLKFTQGEGWTGLHFAPLARAEKLRMLDMGAGERFINYANFNLSAPNLEYFRCERCYLMDIGAQSLSLSPSLQELQIPGNNIGPEGARWLASMPNLRVLNLRENQILDEGARNLSASRSIVELDVGGTAQHITAAGAADLAQIPTLRSIDLSSNPIGDRGVHNLVLGRPELTGLGLAITGITDASLADIRLLSDLEKLYLLRNNLTGQGLQQLAGLSRMRSLMLGWMRIGPGNLRFIESMPDLEYLVLNGAVLGNEDMERIARLSKLIGLSLWAVDGPDHESYRLLKNLRALKWITVPRSTPPEIVAELREALPECQVQIE